MLHTNVSCQQQQIALHYSGDQIKNEMGGEGGLYGGQNSCIQDFDVETWWKEMTWKSGVVLGLEWSASGQELVAGCCERGNEPMGSIRGKKFLE